MATTIPVRIEAELDQPPSRWIGILTGGGVLLALGAIESVLTLASGGRPRPASAATAYTLGSSCWGPQ